MPLTTPIPKDRANTLAKSRRRGGKPGRRSHPLDRRQPSGQADRKGREDDVKADDEDELDAMQDKAASLYTRALSPKKKRSAISATCDDSFTSTTKRPARSPPLHDFRFQAGDKGSDFTAFRLGDSRSFAQTWLMQAHRRQSAA